MCLLVLHYQNYTKKKNEFVSKKTQKIIQRHKYFLYKYERKRKANKKNVEY